MSSGGVVSGSDRAGTIVSGTRSEGRVGPQPWPTDLPDGWPLALAGQVVADTRTDGDRLLLVDVRESRRETVEAYADALRAEGFRVEVGEREGTPALRAIGGSARAELTFFAGETVTRVEILFPSAAAG